MKTQDAGSDRHMRDQAAAKKAEREAKMSHARRTRAGKRLWPRKMLSKLKEQPSALRTMKSRPCRRSSKKATSPCKFQRDPAHRVGADDAQAKAQLSDANLRTSWFKNEASTFKESLENEQGLRVAAENRINELRHELQISAKHLFDKKAELIESGEENMSLGTEIKSLRADSAELAAQLKSRADDAAVIRQEANQQLKVVTMEVEAERKNLLSSRSALQEAENQIPTSQQAVVRLESEVAAVKGKKPSSSLQS
ncbi:hypothetical protein BSKO_12636 [Bryopsis sp. KO-2023]|nr:hypothetical protein BSKO_12636 [Bryopsis sp. KO-2023]